MRRRFVLLFPLLACGAEREGAPPDDDADGYRVPDDCDDHDRSVNPAAVEFCDGDDNDCDGTVDVDATDMSAFYVDADSDGFGSGEPIEACEAPTGTVTNAYDCDDTNGEVHFGAVDVCGDGIDNNCDGEAPGCDWLGLIHASDASEVIWAAKGGLHLGTSVAGAGDMNGDGVGDLAVGTNQGLAFVFLGPVTSTTTASASATFEDATGDETFGWFHGGVDVDADGYDDLLGQSQGTLYVIGGPVSGSTTPAEAAMATLVGEPNTYFGYAPTAGDLNGDGIPDVVVGAPFEDDGCGASYVYYGPVTAGELGAVDADAAVVGTRESFFNGEFEEYGTMVGGANDADGDVDGDGIDDLLAGSWNYAEAPKLWFGPIVGSSLRDADVIVHDTQGSSYLGRALSIGGDLDGDGLHDLAIAAPWANQVGAVFLFYADSVAGVSDLDDVSADATMRGSSGTELGYPVETDGDFDADGADDLVTIGSDVIGFYGPVWGELAVEDASFRVIASNRNYTWTAFVGDVGETAADDLAIGRPDDGVGGLSSVYLFYDGFL